MHFFKYIYIKIKALIIFALNWRIGQFSQDKYFPTERKGQVKKLNNKTGGVKSIECV